MTTQAAVGKSAVQISPGAAQAAEEYIKLLYDIHAQEQDRML
jgi:hypothetical protein